MSRTPQRRGERKFIQVGSIWTNGSQDVKVMFVQSYGDYRYIVYRIVGQTYKRLKDETAKPRYELPYYETPLDDLTFSLRFDAKVVRKEELKVLAEVAKRDLEEGKMKNVTWA